MLGSAKIEVPNFLQKIFQNQCNILQKFSKFSAHFAKILQVFRFIIHVFLQNFKNFSTFFKQLATGSMFSDLRRHSYEHSEMLETD